MSTYGPALQKAMEGPLRRKFFEASRTLETEQISRVLFYRKLCLAIGCVDRGEMG